MITLDTQYGIRAFGITINVSKEKYDKIIKYCKNKNKLTIDEKLDLLILTLL